MHSALSRFIEASNFITSNWYVQLDELKHLLWQNYVKNLDMWRNFYVFILVYIAIKLKQILLRACCVSASHLSFSRIYTDNLLELTLLKWSKLNFTRFKIVLRYGVLSTCNYLAFMLSWPFCMVNTFITSCIIVNSLYLKKQKGLWVP